jgi:hypothetical protein
MKKVLILLAVSIFFSLSSFAQSCCSKKAKTGAKAQVTVNQKVEKMTAQLNLSEEQAEEITQILEKHRAKAQKLKAKKAVLKEKQEAKINALLTAEQKEQRLANKEGKSCCGACKKKKNQRKA